MGSGPAVDQYGQYPTDPNYGKPPQGYTANGTNISPYPNPYRTTQPVSQTDESGATSNPYPTQNGGFTQYGPLVPNPNPASSFTQPLQNQLQGQAAPATSTGVQARPLGAAPAGYDPTKWADPNHNNSKYVIGRLVSQYDASTPEGYAAIVAGIKKYAPNATVNGDVVDNLPEGPGAVDFIRDFGPGGANAPTWLGKNDQQAAAPTASAVPGVPGGGVAGGGVGTDASAAANIAAGVGASTTGPTSSGLKGQLEAALAQRIAQSLNINPNDPIIRNQVEAFSGQQQNAMRNYLAQVAEQQGPIANISAERRSANEQVGQNTSNFEASLMANELKARRDEIQNALTQTQAYITDEEKMALEKQLAELDNALQYARLREQASEFGQNLGLDYARLGQQGYQFDVTRQDNLLS